MPREEVGPGLGRFVGWLLIRPWVYFLPCIYGLFLFALFVRVERGHGKVGSMKYIYFLSCSVTLVFFSF